MTMDAAQDYLVAVDRGAFEAQIHSLEVMRGASCAITFDATRNRSVWALAGQVVAEADGFCGSTGASWLVVPLTRFQHRLVVDQVSNNEVASDEELVEFFVQEGGLSPEFAAVPLHERRRCAQNPIYEPLQSLRKGAAGATS